MAEASTSNAWTSSSQDRASSSTDATALHVPTSDNNKYIETVLKRSKVAQIRRTLEQRLGLASFKALRGWSQYNLDAIEPQVEREIAERRKVSREQAVAQEAARRRAFNDCAPHVRSRSESCNQPYPPGQSLFDAMLNSTVSGGLTSVYSPKSDISSAYTGLQPSANATGHQPSAKRARLDGRHNQSRPHKVSTPHSALKHKRAASAASSHVTFDETPFRNFGPAPTSAPPITYRPISTSDPHFAASATEYVEAATALTSFTRAQSTGPLDAEAPIASVITAERPASMPVTSAKDGEERENAADFLLLLANSPSPPRTKRSQSVASGSDIGGASVTSRRLFGDDDIGSNASGQSNSRITSPLSIYNGSRPASTLAPANNFVQETSATVASDSHRGSPSRLPFATTSSTLSRPTSGSLGGAFDYAPTGTGTAAQQATAAAAF